MKIENPRIHFLSNVLPAVAVLVSKGPCCLALTALTPLGEPKCLYGEKLAGIGGLPYHHKSATRLGRPLFLLSQVFVSCKRFTQGSSSRRVTILPGTTFLNKDEALGACLHGGGGPQIGEVTRLSEVTHLSI